MIFTQFGSPVTIVSPVDDDGRVSIRFEDGKVREYGVVGLKAEGGLPEILAAAENARQDPDITNRYRLPVTITPGSYKAGWVQITYYDGLTRRAHVTELLAARGLDDVIAAAGADPREVAEDLAEGR